MILVDSNILIEYRRKPTTARERVFLEEQVCICGIVEAELLHGARSARDLQTTKEALAMLPSLPIPEKMWERVGEMLFHLRQVGYSIPFQDVVIAVLALEYDTKIWTTDKHFIMMQQVAPMLKLFVE